MVNFSERKKKLARLNSVEDFSSKRDETVFESANYAAFDEGSLEGLNEKQKLMVEGIVEYLTTNKENKRYFLIQGGGGSGKSYTIKRAIEHIPPGHIIASAPSHFAKNVLKNFLGEEYKVTTIASLLGKIMKYDAKGDTILIPNKNLIGLAPIYNYDVIIIDEVSMVTDEVVEELLRKTKNKKLILLGDYCQLPPVGQHSDSSFFDKISIELTQPMRFTGPIYKLANHIRDEIHKIRDGIAAKLHVVNIETDRISRVDETGSGYIFLNNVRTMLSLAAEKFKESSDIHHVRVIAFRNETTDRYNNLIRKLLYGANPKQFEQGELIISDGSYSIAKDNRAEMIINNGTVLKVKSAVEVSGPFNIACKELTFFDAKFKHTIYAVSDKGKAQYDEVLKTYKKRAKESPHWWAAYYKFKDSFAHFKYSYAVSAHKAQGSSIKYVFIDEEDILSVKPTSIKEKLQSLYVGISRASFRAYIFNSKFNVDFSELNKEYLRKKAK